MNIDAIRQQAREALERAEKATKGPWDAKDGSVVSIGPPTDEEYCASRAVFAQWYSKYGLIPHGMLFKDDADFIAHAREDVPTLAHAAIGLCDMLEAALTAREVAEGRVRALEEVAKKLSDFLESAGDFNTLMWLERRDRFTKDAKALLAAKGGGQGWVREG